MAGWRAGGDGMRRSEPRAAAADVSPSVYAFYHTGQDNNNVAWSNPVADSLLALGRATLDVAKRQEIYRAFQRIELDDPPVMVLFYPREIQAVTSRLVGFPSLGIRDALRHSERFALRAR